MQIVAILGSPRVQGNSNTLARAFLKAASDRGAKTTEFLVNQLDFQGCQGCGGCKTKSQICILEDELTPVLEAAKHADLLVLASPVYFGDISGQLKCFFDRTYSYFNPDFSSRVPPGRTALLVLAQGDPNPAHFDDIFSRYENWLKLYGFNPVRLLRATGVLEPGDVKERSEPLDQAAALARDLIGQ
jgi:multimeric flavodoxin WrbA